MANPEIVEILQMWAKGGLGRTLAEMRVGFDRIGAPFPVKPDVSLKPVDAGGVPGEWSSTPDIQPGRAILFLHGGGFGMGSTNSHRHLVTEVGRAANASVLAINYRLAPEAPFPAAVDDALAAYRHLLASGFAPAGISIVGDSAGGGLAMSLSLAARDAGLPQPACVVCISPWVDLGMDGSSMDSKAPEDRMVTKSMLIGLRAAYLGNVDASHPLASPIYANLKGLAPLLILVGSAETLLDDSVRLARAAGAAEVLVRFEIWPEMIHVWPLFHPMLAEGRRALATIGAFIREHLG